MKTKKLIFKIVLGVISLGIFTLYLFFLFPWALQLIMPWSDLGIEDYSALCFLTGVFICLMLISFRLALLDSEGKIFLVHVRKNVPFLVIASILLLFITLIHGFIPLVFLGKRHFSIAVSYAIVSLALSCILLFLTFLISKLWERIGQMKTIKKDTVKKQVVLQEIKKPLPKEVDKKKILFISNLDEGNALYQFVRNSTSKYVLITCTSSNIPSNLSDFSLVIVHYVAGFTFSDSLLNKKKIIIPTATTRKQRIFPKNSTVFEQRKGSLVYGPSLEQEIQMLIK